MKLLVTLFFFISLVMPIRAQVQSSSDSLHNVYYNYIGITPTFPIMGMYGLVYARALDSTSIITIVGGYTNYDLSPIPFLHNDNWKYHNVYFGFNYSFFPFSREVFPHGFYMGVDGVPSLGFFSNRHDGTSGSGLAFSADVLVGYSWIIFKRWKLSTDVFLDIDPPTIHTSGVNWNQQNKWTILPFFDVNIGFLF